MNNRTKAVAVSTVGFLCVAIAGWMVSMSGAGWYSPQFSAAILLPLSIVLLAMGILSFVADRGLDAIVFFGGAGVFGSAAAYVATIGTQRVTMSLSYMGWFACMWAVYFLCAWAGSMRSGAIRSGFLLGAWLSLGCLAIAGWSASGGWEMAAGYLGLITAILAFGTAGYEIVTYGRITNPNLEVPRTTAARPMAAD
jgi:succinate-acetate transporter protein